MKNLIVRIKDSGLYYLQFNEQDISKHTFKVTKDYTVPFINFKFVHKKLKSLNGKQDRYTDNSIVIIAQTKHEGVKYLYYITPDMKVRYAEEQSIINLGLPIANGKIVDKRFIGSIYGNYIDIPFKDIKEDDDNNTNETVNNTKKSLLNYLPDNQLLLDCLYKQDLNEWIQKYKNNLDNDKDNVNNYDDAIKLLDYIKHESLNDDTFYNQALGNMDLSYNITIRNDVVKQNSKLGLELFNIKEQGIING